ncbi:hypothetical protein H6F38_14565 [Paenibacillus sp. EKM208P]|nr:hypothetical protein H6F38_14565 [Paenibacillus sp. EKM208P]
MRLYLSKCNDKLNTKELNTEFITQSVCLNPKYKGITIKNPDTKILMDSGAFQDTDKDKRISVEEALERQLKLEKKIDMVSERIVAYDHIGNVEDTIMANNYLVSRREELRPRQLVLMIQGATIKDYIYCLIETLKVASPEDCIGLGGVAMSGRVNDIKFKLLDAIKIGLPIICNSKVKDVHIFGVGTFNVLKEVAYIKDVIGMAGVDTEQLNISCDTSSFEIMSTMGSVIDEVQEKWVKVYSKQQKYIDYHPADLTIENMKKAKKIIERI